ncbi:hypothetical protein BGZ68_007793 [Mortierella alpina]|nr:hypothetical protein BGZ68_007793 [Mortierella alpina]
MDPSIQLADWAQLKKKNQRLLIRRIQSDIIASPWIANPPFGRKKSIYTDFFASSKPLKKFESIMNQQVLPFYANTHTSTTSTSKVTSHSVKLARETIARCTRTNTESGHEHEAAVIFCGKQSHRSAGNVIIEAVVVLAMNDTVAIAELLHRHGAYAFFDYAGVGPYTAIDMNPAPSSTSHHGEPNLPYKDGVFLSTHKFLGGPGSSGVLIARVEIFSWADRNGVHLDKRKGHVSSSLSYSSPANPGGGTVDMVIHGKHKYSSSVIAREEAGTPNILATIRTGLVFRLQETVDPAWILKKEYGLAKMVMARFTAPGLAKAIHVLGASSQDRIAVFSLTVTVPPFVTLDKAVQQRPVPQDQGLAGLVEQDNNDRPLQIHYALLSTIMNDFFGIEMRGGCMCAGPYASKLLQFDAVKEAAFWRLLMGETRSRHDGDHDDEGVNHHQQRDLYSKSLKPGFVRLSFSYFTRDKDIEFVLQSLEWVAQYGYLLVPLYTLDAHSGEWSTREAVRKAVYAEISPVHARCGSREHCIPAAVACIYGLKKLFREQLVLLSRSPAGSTISDAPRLGQEVFLQSRNNSSSNSNSGGDNINNTTSSVHGGGVFASVAQARKSLNNVLSDVFNRPSTSNNSSAHSLSTVPPRLGMRSDALSATMRDDHEQAVFGDSSFLPSSSEYSSMNSGFSAAAVSRQVHDLEQGSAVASSSSSSLSSLGTYGRSGGGGRDPINVKRATKTNKLRLFSAKRSSISTQKRQVFKQALEELGDETLQSEVEAVENSPLAKELRWFVMPWEVAQVYRRQLMHPSDVSSPFPNRV